MLNLRSTVPLQGEIADLIQAAAERMAMAEAAETEAKCREFVARTGLNPKEGVLVRFRGKTFVQWCGAVSSMNVVRYEEC